MREHINNRSLLTLLFAYINIQGPNITPQAYSLFASSFFPDNKQITASIKSTDISYTRTRRVKSFGKNENHHKDNTQIYLFYFSFDSGGLAVCWRDVGGQQQQIQ